jgi:hypothetical protein
MNEQRQFKGLQSLELPDARARIESSYANMHAPREEGGGPPHCQQLSTPIVLHPIKSSLSYSLQEYRGVVELIPVKVVESFGPPWCIPFAAAVSGRGVRLQQLIDRCNIKKLERSGAKLHLWAARCREYVSNF